MDLALNNLQMLICHKTQTNKLEDYFPKPQEIGVSQDSILSVILFMTKQNLNSFF